MAEKGLNRGGAGGQLGDLGEEQANLHRPGWNEEQGNLNRQGNLKRKGEGLGRTGLDQGAQRGGLQREPNLAGREEETGHEVD
ncbi:MAG: hypothetical protein ACJ78Y_23265 [Myxococcales bacterium]